MLEENEVILKVKIEELEEKVKNSMPSKKRAEKNAGKDIGDNDNASGVLAQVSKKPTLPTENVDNTTNSIPILKTGNPSDSTNVNVIVNSTKGVQTSRNLNLPPKSDTEAVSGDDSG